MERTSSQWFEEASRYYLEGHQACAWCRVPHQVYKVQTSTGIAYHCHRCEFHVAHDTHLNRYVLVPGEGKPGKKARLTMHEI
jgi:hypothetical protein